MDIQKLEILFIAFLLYCFSPVAIKYKNSSSKVYTNKPYIIKKEEYKNYLLKKYKWMTNRLFNVIYQKSKKYN